METICAIVISKYPVCIISILGVGDIQVYF